MELLVQRISYLLDYYRIRGRNLPWRVGSGSGSSEKPDPDPQPWFLSNMEQIVPKMSKFLRFVTGSGTVTYPWVSVPDPVLQKTMIRIRNPGFYLILNN